MGNYSHDFPLMAKKIPIWTTGMVMAGFNLLEETTNEKGISINELYTAEQNKYHNQGISYFLFIGKSIPRLFFLSSCLSKKEKISARNPNPTNIIIVGV